jgi:hypothetical protein
MTIEWSFDMRTIYGFIYTLRPYERGIRETLGKYAGFVMLAIGQCWKLDQNKFSGERSLVTGRVSYE